MITKHGVKRAKQRLGLPKKAVERQALRALEKGKSPKDYSGNFKVYLDAIAIRHKTRPIVYANYIYAFGPDNQLITVLPIDKKYWKKI